MASLLAAIVILGTLIGAGLFASIRIWPEIGAQAADWLRQVIGDEAVARLETLALDGLDFLHIEQYKLAGSQPAIPWTPLPVQTPPATGSSTEDDQATLQVDLRDAGSD
ncbi:MAG TPA: hypothetical protein VF498_05950, partial [Anaerolineales bacterium]